LLCAAGAEAGEPFEKEDAGWRLRSSLLCAPADGRNDNRISAQGDERGMVTGIVVSETLQLVFVIGVFIFVLGTLYFLQRYTGF